MTKVFKDKQGFTLIELLVVIAIIGILSSIVLISLKGAKDRANDGRIISDMSQLRTQAEIVHDNDGDYDCVCTASTTACTTCDTSITTLKDDMNALNGSKTDLAIYRNAASGADAYCAEIELNSGKWYCVDSTLRAKQYDSNPACSNATFTCE